MKNILDGYVEELSSPIPQEIVERQDLIGFPEAFRRVHFPPDGESLEILNLYRSDGHRQVEILVARLPTTWSQFQPDLQPQLKRHWL